MNSVRVQKGQAMVFGLLFLAVVIMTLLTLFNQGLLVKHRVQLENAVDATVYSQAKLAARNKNFIAYTNRAMVANEVSIGQMVALLSWAKRYKNMRSFVNFPLYNVPIAPPSPVTYSNVLAAVTTPYVVMGEGVGTVADPITAKWPVVVSYFNSTLGVFQKLFALTTVTAQFEMNEAIRDGYEFSTDPDKEELHMPVVGLFFLAQNAALTYFGDIVPAGAVSGLSTTLGFLDTSDASGDELVGDFLGGQTEGPLESMINPNSPSVSKPGDGSVEAYKYYQAIVNNNRDPFTLDRHWDIGVTIPDLIPEITLPFFGGLVLLTVDLDLSVWVGLKADGGAAYVSDGNMSTNSDISTLGWSAIDVMSFGMVFDIGIYVLVEVCLPPFGCEDVLNFDVDFEIPIGLPLGAGTHQMVSNTTKIKRSLPEWEAQNGDGIYGGDPDDDVNNGPFDLFHLAALGYGSISPPPGIYGTNVSADVDGTYAAPPAFLSLGKHFQESAVSYELTAAIAKDLKHINTTDNDNPGIDGPGAFDIGNDDTSDPEDWDNGDIAYTRFELDTYSRAEEGQPGLEDDIQRFNFGQRPMMSISSAEVYFANPMQIVDGRSEPASLFSPFWDARLREPSAFALLLATGEVDWDELLSGMPSTAIAVTGYVLNLMAEQMVEQSIDLLRSQLGTYGAALDGPLDALGEEATNQTGNVIDGITDTLEEL